MNAASATCEPVSPPVVVELVRSSDRVHREHHDDDHGHRRQQGGKSRRD